MINRFPSNSTGLEICIYWWCKNGLIWPVIRWQTLAWSFFLICVLYGSYIVKEHVYCPAVKYFNQCTGCIQLYLIQSYIVKWIYNDNDNDFNNLYLLKLRQKETKLIKVRRY